MRDNGVCSLLGLAKRAGKLAAGDEPVREMLHGGVIRALFLTEDAGDAAARQAAFLAGKAKAPLLILPCTRQELGGALGRGSCAMCAVSDIGFAASAAKKLSEVCPEYAADAASLAIKNTRIQSRRGVKKHRKGENNRPWTKHPSQADKGPKIERSK